MFENKRFTSEWVLLAAVTIYVIGAIKKIHHYIGLRVKLPPVIINLTTQR